MILAASLRRAKHSKNQLHFTLNTTTSVKQPNNELELCGKLEHDKLSCIWVFLNKKWCTSWKAKHYIYKLVNLTNRVVRINRSKHRTTLPRSVVNEMWTSTKIDLHLERTHRHIYFLTIAIRRGEITFERYNWSIHSKQINKQNTQSHKEDALIDTKEEKKTM